VKKIKKNQFLNWDDLENYIKSAKKRHLTIYSKVSSKYSGIIETLYLHSEESGKKLTFINDFDSYGLDWMGDLSKQIRLSFSNLSEMIQYCEKMLKINFQNFKKNLSLPNELPSVNDSKEKIESYKKGWDKLCHDYDNKILNFFTESE